MMNKKKVHIMAVLVCMAVAVLFSGCNASGPGETEKVIGPEVGSWHAELKLSDIHTDSMSDEDKMLFSMLAGNIVFEMNAEFLEDGTFSYVINTDELEEGLSQSLSTMAGYFMDFDISLFTDRLIEAALAEVTQNMKDDYIGTYTVEDDIITAEDEGTLYFKVSANRLIQLDENGNEFVRFEKAANSEG